MSHETYLKQLEDELSQIRKEMVEYDRKYRDPYTNINNKEKTMQTNTYSKYITEVNTSTKDLHRRIVILDTTKYQEDQDSRESPYHINVDMEPKIHCMYTHSVSSDEAENGCDISVTKQGDKYYTVFSVDGVVMAMCNYGDLYVPYQQQYYFDNTKLVYEEAIAQYNKKYPNN